MLVFAVYYLLKNPDTMRKLRDEIDSVMGQRPFTTADMNTMPYLIGTSASHTSATLPVLT